MSGRACAALGLALAAAVAVVAPSRGQEPEFRASADVVVLDVVVKDKEGRTVRDLRPEEIRVTEDGVSQQVLSFRLLAAGERRAAASAPEAEPSEPAAPRDARPRAPGNLVTLVFDQLGPDGRRIARQAGLALAGLTDEDELLVSVFKVSESLRLVQQFTSQRAAVEAAVKQATGSVNTQYTNATDELQKAADIEAEARRRLESMGAVTSGAQAGRAAELGRAAAIGRMAVDALRMTQGLQREQQGHASLYALLALSKQQQRLAGRKTILFFSEGIQVPASLEHVLHAAISEANRANVSVYTVDARGLTDTRRLESTYETLQQAAAAVQRQMLSGDMAPVTREEVFALDNAEAALRMDVQGALQDLAEGTGGALIADTNDIGRAIRRAVGDMRGYYEVVYAPSNPAYDGGFRRIEVRVSRPHTRVQARSGYYAMPPGEGAATYAYEVKLLQALRQEPLRYEFATRAGAFRFGPEADGVRHTLVMEVPLSGIALRPEANAETDRAHFSILAVLRDASGLVVQKFSEDAPLVLPRARRAALQSGNAVFLRSFVVPAGRYTLELAVLDQLAERYSVRRSTLVVERPPAGLSVSDVALIKRSESVSAQALASDDPFRQGTTRLVPWLSEPRVGPDDNLSVFLVAYPPKPARTDALLEFLKDGAVTSQSLSELPQPDARGRVPFVATVPTRELAPGRYEVRLLLKQGGLVAQRQAHFVVGEAQSP